MDLTAICAQITEYVRLQIEELQQAIEPIVARVRQIELTEVAAKVYEIVLQVFYVILACALARMHLQIFIAGCWYSGVDPKGINDTIYKINATWEKQNFALRAFTVLSVILAWPLTILVASFLAGGKTGIILQELNDSYYVRQ